MLRTLKADDKVSHIPVVMASIIDEKKKGFSLGPLIISRNQWRGID